MGTIDTLTELDVSNKLPLYIYIMYWLVPRTSLTVKITNLEKLRLFNSFWVQHILPYQTMCENSI